MDVTLPPHHGKTATGRALVIEQPGAMLDATLHPDGRVTARIAFFHSTTHPHHEIPARTTDGRDILLTPPDSDALRSDRSVVMGMDGDGVLATWRPA